MVGTAGTTRLFYGCCQSTTCVPTRPRCPPPPRRLPPPARPPTPTSIAASNPCCLLRALNCLRTTRHKLERIGNGTSTTQRWSIRNVKPSKNGGTAGPILPILPTRGRPPKGLVLPVLPVLPGLLRRRTRPRNNNVPNATTKKQRRWRNCAGKAKKKRNSCRRGKRHD